MKIQIIKANRMINISYDGTIGHKQKNKTFREGDYIGVLDFALNLPDRYVVSCSGEVWDWAIKNKHVVLKSKSWAFC